MIGLFVRGRRFGRTVHLYKDEPRRIVPLLYDVEARDTRLLNAVACVLESGLP